MQSIRTETQAWSNEPYVGRIMTNNTFYGEPEMDQWFRLLSDIAPNLITGLLILFALSMILRTIKEYQAADIAAGRNDEAENLHD